MDKFYLYFTFFSIGTNRETETSKNLECSKSNLGVDQGITSLYDTIGIVLADAIGEDLL